MAKDNLDEASSPGKAKTLGKGTPTAGAKRKTAKERLQIRAKAAGISGWEGMTEKKLRNELQRIKSEGGKVPDLRSGNSAPQSLSKDPKVAEWKKSHLMEEVEVVVTDRSTGTSKVQKKATMLAILDVLRQEALKSKSVPAAREYFDRTLGKAKQEVEFSTDLEAENQRPPTARELEAARLLELDVMEEDEEDDEDGATE